MTKKDSTNLPTVKTLTDDQQAFMIRMLCRWERPKRIYDTMTAETFTEETGIERLDPEKMPYKVFTLIRRAVPIQVIAEGHELWLKEHDTVKYAEQKHRLDTLSIQVDNLLENNAIQNSSEVRLCLEQIRKEIQGIDEEKAGGTTVNQFFLKGHAVNITPEGISDLILIMRHEFDGLHNMGLEALSIGELEQLVDRAETIIEQKRSLDSVEPDYEILEQDDDEGE
jgi:hypothetical protein